MYASQYFEKIKYLPYLLSKKTQKDSLGSRNALGTMLTQEWIKKINNYKPMSLSPICGKT